MRLHLDIATAASELPWSRVLEPGRGVAYDLLARSDPELSWQLHNDGWGMHRMVPFGHGAPRFPSAPHRPGAYAAGGKGVLEFGSPVPAVAEALASALATRELLDWGGTALRVLGMHVVESPGFAGGRATLRTETPVVLKAVSPDQDGDRVVWVLPTEPLFPECLRRNLIRKAQTLGVSPELELEAITWVGSKRSFAVGGGAKPGAAVEIVLRGEPETLWSLWSWGLGEANSAGFGWIRAER
jgi:CRISPR-associated endoribonuclease Cas6